MNTKITISFDMDGEKWIWLDCDGTWINLYGVPNWLEMLQNEDTTPYRIAKPLVNLSWLARTLNELQKQNIKIGIISWLSKNGSNEYNQKVTYTKMEYFAKHLPSVIFDAIHIVPYGTPKEKYCNSKNDILFDDEKQNIDKWIQKGGQAFSEKDLIQSLRAILRNLG